MFLKQEKPEMKIFLKMRIPLQKVHKDISAYSFVSEHSKHFLFIWKKNFLRGRG